MSERPKIKVLSTTAHLTGKQPNGVKVKATNDEGWLRVVIEADEGIVGYAVTVNGRDLPGTDSEAQLARCRAVVEAARAYELMQKTLHPMAPLTPELIAFRDALARVDVLTGAGRYPSDNLAVSQQEPAALADSDIPADDTKIVSSDHSVGSDIPKETHG